MTRVAVLERFANESRRLPLSALADGGHPEVWELHATRGETLRRLPRTVTKWLTAPITIRDKARLLACCLGTKGTLLTPLNALYHAPDLWDRVVTGGIDSVACFSAKCFPLATAIADRTGRPCDEFLAAGTRYYGEFAFELLAVVPYAYWLHTTGKLRFTESSADTRDLYYFSPRHEERSGPRRYAPITEYSIGEPAWRRLDRRAFPKTLDVSRWRPPPYRTVYANETFRWPRKLCVVSNKTSPEPTVAGDSTLNGLDIPLLLATVGRLRDRYQVVYNRPHSSDMVEDGQRMREIGDIEALKKAYPDVLTIQDLRRAHPHLSYNELQLRLYANCEAFVSVLGGSSYLSSYYGGTNIVYARKGWEVSCGAFDNWFHKFSGARVVAVSSPEELLRRIDELL